MRRRSSLRLTVPAGVFLFTVGLALWNVQINSRASIERGEQHALLAMKRDMTALQAALEDALQRSDMEWVQERLGELTADPSMVDALLLDPEGTIVASARRDLIGKSSTILAEGPHAGAEEWRLEMMAQTRDQHLGLVRFTPDGRCLLGVYPVLLGPGADTSIVDPTGFAYLHFDLTELRSAALVAVRQQSLDFILGLGALAVALGLFLHLFVTRRIESLAEAVRQTSDGHPGAAAVVGPLDEIGLLAVGFNGMVVRKTATESTLRANEARMQLALDAGDLGIWDWDIRTGEMTCNDRWAQIGGHLPGEFEPEPDLTMRRIHPRDRPRAMSALNAHLAGKTEFYESEHRVRHTSGEWIWVSAKGKAIERDDDGNPLRVCGTRRDISRRMLAEQERRDRLDQQSAVAALAKRALANVDPEVIMQRAVTLLTENLDVDSCAVLRLLPNGEEMLLVAGTGWRHGLAGLATVPITEGSAEAKALQSTEPVVVDDAAEDSGFSAVPRKLEDDVASGMTVRVEGRTQPFGVLCAQTQNQRHFKRHEVGFLLAIANVIAESVARRRSEDAVAQMARRLRHLAERLLQAREDERTIMARELHDELGQSLTAINMDLAWMQTQLGGSTTDLQSRLSETVELIGNTINTVRRISSELRPPALDDLGLFDAIAWHADTFAQRAGLELRFELPDTIPEMDPDAATAVFRIVQESLTNVARHAEASEVRVLVTHTGDALEVRVIDNGCGIPPIGDKLESSLGLLGMKERAAAFGGQVNFRGTPDGGTEVAVTFPLECADRRASRTASE